MKLRTANKILNRAAADPWRRIYTDSQQIKASRVTARHNELTKAVRRAGHPTPLDSQLWPKIRGLK